MITARNRTLGQREMQQAQSAAPPFIADGQARCGKERVIVGQGGEPTVNLQHRTRSIWLKRSF